MTWPLWQARGPKANSDTNPCTRGSHEGSGNCAHHARLDGVRCCVGQRPLQSIRRCRLRLVLEQRSASHVQRGTQLIFEYGLPVFWGNGGLTNATTPGAQTRRTANVIHEPSRLSCRWRSAALREHSARNAMRVRATRRRSWLACQSHLLLLLQKFPPASMVDDLQTWRVAGHPAASTLGALEGPGRDESSSCNSRGKRMRVTV
jgi:hypothetical protein